MQMSIDGFVSAAKPDLDWQVWGFGDNWAWDNALKREFNSIFESIDGIVLSRKMLQEGYLDHWQRAATKHADDANYAFARKIGATNKYVVTNKLDSVTWERTVVVKGDFAEAVKGLKRQPGGDLITFGGVGFASSLVDAGLVDEFQFFINPTAVGQGRSLFGGRRDGVKFRLAGSTSYNCGIVVNRYTRR